MYRQNINNQDAQITVRMSSKERKKLEDYCESTGDMISRVVRKCLRDADLI